MVQPILRALAQQYNEALEQAAARGCQVCGAPVTVIVDVGDQFEAEFDHDGTMWAKITSRVQLRCDEHKTC